MQLFLIVLTLLVAIGSLVLNIGTANMLVMLADRLEQPVPKKKPTPEGGLIDPPTAPNFVSDAEVKRQPNYTDIINQNVSSSLTLLKDE